MNEEKRVLKGVAERFIAAALAATAVLSSSLPAFAMSDANHKIVNEMEKEVRKTYKAWYVKNGYGSTWEARFRTRTGRWQAHRGYSAYAPENTAAAFFLAAQVGAFAIEADVNFSKDGTAWMLHDASPSKNMTEKKYSKNLWEYSDSEISKMKVTGGNNASRFEKSNLGLCTFKEYVQICRRYGVCAVIEIKENAGIPASVRKKGFESMCGWLEYYKMWDNCKVFVNKETPLSVTLIKEFYSASMRLRKAGKLSKDIPVRIGGIAPTDLPSKYGIKNVPLGNKTLCRLSKEGKLITGEYPTYKTLNNG